MIVTVCINSIAADASEIDDACGPQGTPRDTWKSWQQAFLSGEWKRWFECHDKGAQAGLFLNAAISTPDSEAKTQVMEKYGRCDSRSRASLECVTQETVADFFNDMTTIDQAASRTRLAKIWRKEGAQMDEARLVSVDSQDDRRATAMVQSEGSEGNVDSWPMSFVRIDERWFVTFKWGM